MLIEESSLLVHINYFLVFILVLFVDKVDELFEAFVLVAAQELLLIISFVSIIVKYLFRELIDVA